MREMERGTLHERGFTMVELLVVIAIVAVLSTMAFVKRAIDQ